MIGRELPIQLKPITLTATASGGTVESYGELIADFAEVSDVREFKESQTTGQGQQQLKKFKIDYRPSLAINDKWLIVFDSQTYTILTITTEKNKKFQYVITAKAKV